MTNLTIFGGLLVKASTKGNSLRSVLVLFTAAASNRGRRTYATAPAATLLILVLLAGIPLSSPRRASAASATVDTVTLPSSNYPVPAGAIFVSPGGNDSNSGTQSAPKATVAAAIASASTGSTIVLRAGTYRQAIGTVAKRITIQPYSGETVALKGSVPVGGWVQDGSVWRKDGWTTRFCQTCHNPAVIDPAYPLAASPDMVFIDGLPLTQVSSKAALGSGRFFVDYTNSKLYVGSNPSGRLVEAASHGRAVLFNGESGGSIVRGLGFLHYAPNYGRELGAIVVSAPDLTFENNTIAWSATRGLSIHHSRVDVRNNSIVNNGAEGLHGHYAHGVMVDTNRMSFNNQEGFVDSGDATAASGAKFTATHDMVMRNNRAESNRGNGLWCDLSCYNATIVSNLTRENTKNGISYEISAKAIIASNVAVDNGVTGLKIAGSNRVRVYNNTVANNDRQMSIYEDARVNGNAEDRALGITWDTNNVVVKNNIFSTNGSDGEVVHTHDNTHPDVASASEMIPVMDFSAYYRASTGAPSRLIRWCRENQDAFNLASLQEFRTATGRETNGTESAGLSSNPFFVDEAAGNYSVKTGSTAVGTGEPLPADVASAIGVSSGVKVNRGALVWPGMTSTTPTPTPTTVSMTPIYRLRNKYSEHQFLTASAAERDAAVSKYGYIYEKVAFHGLSATDPDAVPVYRLVNKGDHLYTTSSAERDSAVSRYGYTYEMVGFYASSSGRTGLVPVHRFLRKADWAHTYLSNQTELDAMYAAGDHSYEKVAFYATP